MDLFRVTDGYEISILESLAAVLADDTVKGQTR